MLESLIYLKCKKCFYDSRNIYWFSQMSFLGYSTLVVLVHPKFWCGVAFRIFIKNGIFHTATQLSSAYFASARSERTTSTIEPISTSLST